MGSRADSESCVPPRTYGMAGPVMHLCYDEREGHLHGYSDHEKEMLKRIILEHEVVFRGQVHELHKLWRVQRDLMLEYERNPFQRNYSSSPIPPPQRSTNENNSFFYSNQSQPNFGFVREGSAQSSANIVPAKTPMFDLQIPANEYEENENGMENGSGLGKLPATISCFDKSGAVCSANWAGTSTRERIFVSDLNEPVKVISGLDFLGVNRDPVQDRPADEGYCSGLFNQNRKRSNEELFIQKEKGESSSAVNFFNRDRNHQPNFTPGDSLGINFFSPYRSHQSTFQDHHAVVPQLFGQKLTFNIDPSQAQSNHIFSSNNSTSTSNNNNDDDNNNNNSMAATSFPVLDSSPHYGNSNKNKGLIEGSIHPRNPFFNNISGTAIRSTSDGSGFSLNVPHNLIFGCSRDRSDFAKSNCEKNFNSGTSMDLNEPISEGNRETKGIKLFGSNFGGLVSEADWQKNKINLNNTANEDELSQKASSSASVVVGEPNSSNKKLLGFPFFGNSSSSNKKPALHVDGSNKSERRANFEHAGPAKRAVIDLNDLPLETDLDSSKESKEGKIDRCLIDLEMPASQFEDPNTDMQQHDIVIERENGLDLSVTEAANNILAISQLKINLAPSSPPDALLWFADLAVSGCDKLGSGHESESEDLFESMTLKLEEVKSDDRFGTGNFCEKNVQGESSSRAGESGYTSLLFTRGRRGPTRKRRQRRDFQRDVLPTIASLSRVEVTEDLQMIGGLMRACGLELDSALTRRVGRGCSNAKGKRQQRTPQVNQSLRTPQVKQPDKHPSQTSSLQFPPQVNLRQANPPVGIPPQANIVQRNNHINPPQRISKASHPQRIPPLMKQQPTVPLVNQPHGGPLMAPPQNVSLENQQPRTVQPNQPQKITLVNQVHRFKLFNQRQRVAPINASQNMPPVHQPHGVTEVRHSDMALITNQMNRNVQNNQPQRSVQDGQSHTSAQAIESQSVSVANPQQIVNKNSDMQSEGLSVIGWGRTTERRNRRPRSLPPAPQQQQPGNSSPPVPSN